MSLSKHHNLPVLQGRRKSRNAEPLCIRAFARKLEEAGVPEIIGHDGSFSRIPAGLELDPDKFCMFYLAEHLFKKWEKPDASLDRSKAARQRFDEAEQLCTTTNRRFSPVYRHHGGFQTVIHTARIFLEELLGSVRGRSDDECRQALLMGVQKHFNFGPGASTRLPRVKGDKAYKYSGIPEVTSKCAHLAETFIRVSPIWTQIALSGENNRLAKAVGSRIVTVPKNYKTDRTIAIEPCMNMYIQKGLGGFIRSRLKRVGIDLDDQTKNQSLAKEGSIDGSLATIDLSMASDTVAYYLVKSLFPSHICDFIEETRTDYGVHPDGTVTCFQKVSSMGNGFTFELESALFWALSKAVITLDGTSDSRFSVYGDDIIVPSVVVPRLFEVLEYCGFIVNDEKSFWTGGFRESCGKHYMKGQDVTPFYIKNDPRTVKEKVLLHNQLWRWRDRVAYALDQSTWDSLTGILEWIKSQVPASYRKLRIPDGFGDGGFTSYLSEISISKKGRKYNGFDIVMLPAFSDVPQSIDCELPGLLVKSLLRLETRSYNKSSFRLVDRINRLCNVSDGLPILPINNVRSKVTMGKLKIPIPVFSKLTDSYASYEFNQSTFLKKEG